MREMSSRLSMILWLLAMSTVIGQETGVATRPGRDIILHLDKGNAPVIHLASAPYISQDVITLYPGDKIFVEFDIVDSKPTNPKVVKENIHPERTLELEMKQDKDITFLSRKSGFDRPLTMDSYFLLFGSDFKNHANMYPLDKTLPSMDSFEPKTYCIKLYSFGFAEKTE